MSGIGWSIQPFYGQDATDALLGLLAGLWGAIKAYNGVRLDSEADAERAGIEQLTANACEIVKFHTAANTYLPEDAVFGLPSVHGPHHVSQINQTQVAAISQTRRASGRQCACTCT